MKTFLFAMTALTAVAGATSASAATTITASGRGWYNQSGGNNGISATNNYAAGNCGAGDCNVGEFRNFFTFNLPTFTGTVSSATLILDAANLLLQQNSSAVYTITSTSGFSFGQLGTGTVFSSGSLTGTQSNQLVSFQFNAAGLAALQSGQSITLSGRVTSPTTFSASAPDQLLFGSSQSRSASLQFDTVAAAVPEPATWALMILGMGAVGFAMRRRKNVNMTVRFA
ncbi:PEPxxWA-CTERM sorting domain-containing protein [Sphingomonas sp. XXL09]|uniref:PEPxxWA-CTERM sorting domain-containing protein n=1 Tax=Sphingomonas sp. XXL09 TaxID=3457787 RepID=UPI00406BB77F